MVDEGFADADAGLPQEFAATAGAFGEPAQVTPRSRTARTAAVAVGIAVALGAGGYGVAVAASGSGAAPGGAAAPAANPSSSASRGAPAPGCRAANLRGTAGTLKSDNGSTLTVQSPDNTTNTVTTTSSTLVERIASGSLGDLANGDKVLVGGTFANNTLTAKNIVVGSGLDLGSRMAPDGSATWSGRGFASGTVTAKTSSGFTVATADGGSVTVLTSSSPTVETVVKITVGDLRVGQRVAVAGTAGSNGTISATQVEEIDTSIAVPHPGFGFGFGPGFGFGFGPGPRGVKPSDLPSGAPSGMPERLAPPHGPGGFGFRAHGEGPLPCGTATANPSASSANPGA